MSDHKPELPKRNAGSHLPAAAYRVIGVARVLNITDERWHLDEQTLPYGGEEGDDHAFRGAG